MGDWFQVMVDQEASLKEAHTLALQVRDWLAEQDIINSTLSNCVLGGDGQGYAPGAHYTQVVEDHQASDIRNFQVNGLRIIVGRTVFHAGQGEQRVSCPQCQTEITYRHWGKAITEWQDGGGGMLRCTSCNMSRGITEWQFEPAWGFGNLGFEFWNWPPFKADFVLAFSQRINHPVSLVSGKL